jgi:hypothetical protein
MGRGAPVNRSEDRLRHHRDAVRGKSRKKLMSLRLDHDLLVLTKEATRQHDLGYQAVIRRWIAECLQWAIREGVDAPESSRSSRRDRAPVIPGLADNTVLASQRRRSVEDTVLARTVASATADR